MLFAMEIRMQADPTPFPRFTAPRDGREFLGHFLTDSGPIWLPTRFENGRFRWCRDGQWSDTANSDILKNWGELGPVIIRVT
jgi:hypothetical protein